MKKLTRFMMFLILAVFLSACSNAKEETKTYELENDGVMTTMVYTYKGDKVSRQKTENVIGFDILGINSKEEAEELFAPLVKDFQNINGLTHNLVYDDSKAVESLEIDYSIVNIKDIEHLPGMTFDDGAKENGISMKKSIELLESQGFKEVK